MFTLRSVPTRHAMRVPITAAIVALTVVPMHSLPVWAASAPQPSATSEQVKPDGMAQVVRTAVRRRGHTCEGAIAVTPAERPVKAHHKTWRLACGDARYLVTFVLDRMVVVEPLD